MKIQRYILPALSKPFPKWLSFKLNFIANCSILSRSAICINFQSNGNFFCLFWNVSSSAQAVKPLEFETLACFYFTQLIIIGKCLPSRNISLFYKSAKVSTRDWTEIILVDSESHWDSVLKIPKIIKICLGKIKPYINHLIHRWRFEIL